MKKIIGIVVLGAMAAFSPMAFGGGGHGGGHFGGGHSSFMPSRGGATFSRGGTWSGRNWSGGNWGGDWRHHHGFSDNQFIFTGGFGFPFFYGYPNYGYDYY